ncbi:MAG: grasp-with-spasm system ATP-grasp peptide maturase [Candidatus Azobacteroides sp.]|nr:grasp-with-spasm system ATP-grasp peptide maturase [Candidatus Azobacteroides sp.]
MVLIISIEEDISTFNVIDWLLCQDKKYIVLFPHESINVSKLFISISDKTVQISSNNDNLGITSLWYRRGNMNVDAIFKNTASIEKIKSKKLLMKQLNKENRDLQLSTIDFLAHQLSSKIDDYIFTHNINKINVLDNAVKVGLKIPETIITTDKSVLFDFLTRHEGKIITKPISEVLVISDNEYDYYTYTSKIDDIQNFPNTFFPSLFQQMIDKDYELRIFFLKNRCYSTAIFSQHDQKTKIDFRNYNREKPNRYIPYQLPKYIEHRIIKLIKNLNLDSGSIDMIVDKQSHYYFLEINPVGQYGMISDPCNYNLDKEIAFNLL